MPVLTIPAPLLPRGSTRGVTACQNPKTTGGRTCSWCGLQKMNIAPEEPAEEEDADLAAAIAASLQESQRPRSSTSAFAPRQTPSTAAAALVTGEADLGLAGLRNEAGEYNCFLNTIIQCLWRCADFRQQVGRDWGYYCCLAT